MGNPVFMLVEKGYKTNSVGGHVTARATGNHIPLGLEQVAGTNTYERLQDAAQKLGAILRDKSWGYKVGDIQIARVEVVRE